MMPQHTPTHLNYKNLRKRRAQKFCPRSSKALSFSFLKTPQSLKKEKNEIEERSHGLTCHLYSPWQDLLFSRGLTAPG